MFANSRYEEKLQIEKKKKKKPFYRWLGLLHPSPSHRIISQETSIN
jgi:hypothetical protein